MKKILNSLFLLIILPAILLACSDTSSNKGKYVDIGGYQLYIRDFGQDAPVVIFDSGSGDDSTVWNNVAPRVAKFAHVVVYDRAGLGKSDAKPGNDPISSQDCVNALKLLLQKENIKPPYILVGHSRGGLNMQLFAQENPNEIAGVVLIDSVSRNQIFHDAPPPKTSQYYREAVSFDESRAQVKKSGAFPSVPLIVLTATNHHESAQREELWQKWQREIAQLSPKGTMMFAWGSGHYIQKQQPQLVVNAIYTLIKFNNLDKSGK